MSDSNGYFEVDGLEPGEYDVIVSWSDDPYSFHYKAPPYIARTGDTNIRLLLPGGGRITGRVLFNGVPLEHYGIALSRPNTISLAPVDVRAVDGRFVIPHIESGTWRILLLGAGTRRKVIEEIKVDQTSLDLGDVVMEHGHRIEGYVRDRAGVLVSDAHVFIRQSLGAARQQSQLEAWFQGNFEAISDLGGRYLFDGVDAHAVPAETPRIWAMHDTLGLSLVSELPKSDTKLDFALSGIAILQGIVCGLEGRHTTVFAVHVDEPQNARMVDVDDEGRFQFEKVPPGDYVVSLGVPQTKPATVTVVDGQTATVTLVTPPTVRLIVRIGLNRGDELLIDPPIIGVRMLITNGVDDRCTLNFVPPGKYRLSFDGVNWTAITVAVMPAEQTVDLRPNQDP
ncbi:MAG: hypothetical protein H0V17_06390 [Deltaproteobacteria bacterium]|nr:hypothetical protein [Deltaproteobacteria bacterium]